jgi:Methane/Phenol/Alkene Hydroxylase
MCTAYLGYMAPASYISNCAVFGAGDLLRRVSLVAYRTRQLADATSSSIGGTERVVWEHNRDVLQVWIARWTPRAEAAAAGLGRLFGQLPSGGWAADTVENAANAARCRVLDAAGLAG